MAGYSVHLHWADVTEEEKKTLKRYVPDMQLSGAFQILRLDGGAEL